MVKMTSFGFALAIGAGLWGAACSSSSTSGTPSGGDDASTEDAAVADTSVADSAAHDSAVADTAPDTATTPDSAVEAGPVCADATSSACKACLMTAESNTCSSQVATCESDTSGSSNPDAGSNLSCAGIVECIFDGGDQQTCAAEGTTTGRADVEALGECLAMACPTSSEHAPIHIPLLPQRP